MEIELPDGTILDAPDDADPSVVAKNYLRGQRIAKLKAENPGEYDSSSPEFAAKYGATSGSSGFENFAAGAGKAIVDTGRGIKQIGLEAYDLVRSPQVQDLIVGTPAEQYRRKIDEVNQRDKALLDTRGGLLGNIAGNVAVTLAPGAALGIAGKATKVPGLVNAGRAISAPTSIRGAAALGAATGAVQPVGTEDSRTSNTLLGGLIGGATQGVVKTVGRIAQPVKPALSRVQTNAVRTLQNAGVPLDAAQASGSQRAAQVKRFLTDNPLTGPGQVRQAEATQAGFTRAALKTIGANSDEAVPEVLDKSLKPIERMFGDVASRNQIKISDPVLDNLANLSEEAKQILEGPQAAIINRQIDEVINKAAGTGSIPGKTYQNLRTTIGSLQRIGTPGVREYGGKLLGVIDDALEQSVSGADLAILKDARVKFRNYNAIFDAVNADTGVVSPSRLYQALNKKAYGAKKALKTGRGETDLFKLARAGRAIIPEKLPNSGTAPRALLQAAIPGLAGAGYGVASEGDLGAAAKYGLLGAALPFAAQKLINSPGGSRYLTQGIQSPIARRALQAGQSPTLRGAAVRQLPNAGLLALMNQQ